MYPSKEKYKKIDFFQKGVRIERKKGTDKVLA
jgi:hypothetical protein